MPGSGATGVEARRGVPAQPTRGGTGVAPRASLDRRAFLKSAGMTALVGAVGVKAPPLVAAAATRAPDGKYDFDTIYDRVGTDCTKWDQQTPRCTARAALPVGMGIADMDFRAAPAITKALQRAPAARKLGLSRYARASDPSSRASPPGTSAGYGVDIDPDSLVIAAGVHPGTHRGAGHVLPARQQGAAADADL